MRFFKLTHLSALLLLASALFVSSCGNKDPEPTTPITITTSKVKDAPSSVSLLWNDKFLQLERYAPGYRPGVAPRALAYMGLAAYEACVSGMTDYKSIAALYPSLNVPKADAALEYHWPTVVNAVYANLMRNFFPKEFIGESLYSGINSLEATISASTTISDEVMARSKTLGEGVANAFWDWSKTDTEGHDAYKDVFRGWKQGTNVGAWVPTTPGPGAGMFPYWGKVRTFAIKESDKLCNAPLPFSEDKNSKLYAQALEVYSFNTPSQSYEDKWIGEFWSDDLVNLTFSPGPRWMAIANQVISAQKSNLETAVVTYAKLGMSLNDAAVACWYSKYYYNIERPESYIRRLIDPKWEPNLNNPLTGDKGITPSFPAYPSGHSTMGGAGGKILNYMLGGGYAMTDNCHKGRVEFLGTPRSFNNFDEMSYENALSRVPLGVHFRMDCEEGVRFGRAIADRVEALPWKK